MSHPKTSSHNYTHILEAFLAKYHLGRGDTPHVAIYHDEWCDIHKEGWCNCDPEITLTTTMTSTQGAIESQSILREYVRTWYLRGGAGNTQDIEETQ